jgi:hypothetical protein
MNCNIQPNNSAYNILNLHGISNAGKQIIYVIMVFIIKISHYNICGYINKYTAKIYLISIIYKFQLIV